MVNYIYIYIYIYNYDIIRIPYIYIALFWALKALYTEGGNLLNHHQSVAFTWMMQCQPFCARTPSTHQLIGGEETVGEFGLDAGVTPLVFRIVHGGGGIPASPPVLGTTADRAISVPLTEQIHFPLWFCKARDIFFITNGEHLKRRKIYSWSF